MKANKFYTCKQTPGLYIFVNYIIKTDLKGILMNVSWWTTDDTTKKRIPMDIQQEHFIPSDQIADWVIVDENNKNVLNYWRPM